MKFKNKNIFLSIGIIIVLIVFTVWKFLPLEYKKYSEVNFGNNIIDNIEKYRVSYSDLPKNGEWKTLEKLDFEMTELGTNPEYKKIDEKNYKLIFVKGFDGPYLTYNSITKRWLIE